MELTAWEKKALSVLPEDGEMTSTDLVKEVYRGKKRPFNAREIVQGKMTRLIRKLNYDGGGVRIVKSPRRGPYPVTYRKEAR